jgi:DNA-binding PadR family transcriptional regulator
MLFSKDFIAAAATPLILSILQQGDSYGYAIIQQVRELSGGEMEWSDGMLYPILHRLEKKGFIESYWQPADTGRRRKYYRLCPAGKAELNEQRQMWQTLQEMLQQLHGGMVNV